MLECGGVGGLDACPVNPPAGGRYPMPDVMPPCPPAPAYYAYGLQMGYDLLVPLHHDYLHVRALFPLCARNFLHYTLFWH